ncbi:MAG: hypothetical protein GY714_07485 [Desulfobacterales bacterium]|nr:hypothetical protein [Desulfobacterales bacterium]MCP4158937.1 hypothetical protein [Deltaproteobacteria bacterium]
MSKLDKYLLCPQCGLHRLYIKSDDNENIYFHVNYQKKPVPTKESNCDLTGYSFSKILCTGCSWKGNMKSLVKYVLY